MPLLLTGQQVAPGVELAARSLSEDLLGKQSPAVQHAFKHREGILAFEEKADLPPYHTVGELIQEAYCHYKCFSFFTRCEVLKKYIASLMEAQRAGMIDRFTFAQHIEKVQMAFEAIQLSVDQVSTKLKGYGAPFSIFARQQIREGPESVEASLQQLMTL